MKEWFEKDQFVYSIDDSMEKYSTQIDYNQQYCSPKWRNQYLNKVK